MVKNLSSSAEHVGLIPGQGTKNPPAAGQLSQCCKEAYTHTQNSFIVF